MPLTESAKRINEIVDGASKLPVEGQEYILAIIKGMLFTHGVIEKHSDPEKGDQRR